MSYWKATAKHIGFLSKTILVKDNNPEEAFSALNRNGCRTWALQPPIDIDEKHPNDKRNPYQSYFYPFDVLNPDAEKVEMTQEAKIRDVSGLKPHIKRKLNRHQAIPPLMYKSQLRRTYNRSLFATFGSKSNVNPAICWPTLEEIRDVKKDEIEYTSSLSEMVAQNYAAKELKLKKSQERLKTIMASMGKMDEAIRKYQQRSDTTQRDTEARRKREAERLEEAREYFGYRISAHDPKFQTLMEERDASRKKLEKAAKKKEKEQKRVARAIAYVGSDTTAPNPASVASTS